MHKKKSDIAVALLFMHSFRFFYYNCGILLELFPFHLSKMQTKLEVSILEALRVSLIVS